MVAEPTVTAVTSPLAFMLATKLLLLLHTPPVVVLVNWVVLFRHTVVEPVMEGTVGDAFTVIKATALFADVQIPFVTIAR